jgi:4-amino-4-deoxy-L-arabinose transferase-like glycosyltransferase
VKQETELLPSEQIAATGHLMVRARARVRRPSRLTVIAALVVIGVGVFFALTLRHGHSWGDDFAMYISHARNIATGHHYTDTGYIYNPAFPEIGPRAYPPVFPILLSPVYLIFGLKLMPMKLELIVLFCAALFACFSFFRRHLTATSSVALILILGLNPFFWDYKDQIMSDVPFLLFAVLSLILIDRHARAEETATGWRVGALIGLAMWAAAGTRTVGFVLVPVLLLADLSAFKRLTRQAAIALGILITMTGFQLLVFGGGIGSYLDQVKPSIQSIKANASRTTLEFERLWGSGHAHGVMLALFWLVSGLAMLGLASRLRRRITVYELFPILYAVPILLWPDSRGTRFWIPVIPFYVFFTLVGAEAVVRAVRPRLVQAGVASLAAGLLLSYGAGYRALDSAAITAGVEAPSSARMFDFVKTDTSLGAVMVFMKPRALALFVDRPASAFRPTISYDAQWRYFQRIHAAYVITGPGESRYLARLLSLHARAVTLVYRDGPFLIYRINHY